MMRLQGIWTQIKLVVVFAWLYGWLAVVREPFWLVGGWSNDEASGDLDSD